MTKLPIRLSRKAVKLHFDRVPAAKWDYWFRHEKDNGLAQLRVDGPFAKAYYSGEGIRDWLLAEGTYGPKDFEEKPAPTTAPWPVRTHRIAA